MKKEERLPQAHSDLSKPGLKLRVVRICNCCGIPHFIVPKNAVYMSDLYWYDCECGTTFTATKDMFSNA